MWYKQTSARKYEKIFTRMWTCLLIGYCGWNITIFMKTLLKNLIFGELNGKVYEQLGK